MNHLTNEPFNHLQATCNLLRQVRSTASEQSTIFNLFMQNKPNLLDTQMNVSSVKTKDYENEIVFRFSKNKPKQSQFQT